ncbi:hypothetical protein ACFXDE_01570 [Kitasatospora sp. NPDC059408]|uniref:hypothetical protein n=1 Tax=Kitasatospora sp. NPDC059408 TaxID=3346823 RepID=UPI0036CC25C2
MPSALAKWRSALSFATAVGLAATLFGAVVRDRTVELASLAVLTVAVASLLAASRSCMSPTEVLALRERTQAEAFAMAIELWRDGQLDTAPANAGGSELSPDGQQ